MGLPADKLCDFCFRVLESGIFLVFDFYWYQIISDSIFQLVILHSKNLESGNLAVPDFSGFNRIPDSAKRRETTNPKIEQLHRFLTA
jgi:hypothetical protein